MRVVHRHVIAVIFPDNGSCLLVDGIHGRIEVVILAEYHHIIEKHWRHGWAPFEHKVGDRELKCPSVGACFGIKSHESDRAEIEVNTFIISGRSSRGVTVGLMNIQQGAGIDGAFPEKFTGGHFVAEQKDRVFSFHRGIENTSGCNNG